MTRWQKFIPEFRGGDRERVVIRHLLTHTSGLPDMLPENEELRKRHAPLREFVTATCRTPLLFTPGTKVSYQSMGVLLAGEIVERITGRPLREFLRRQLFQPLGMRNTSLGLGGRKIPDTMQCQVDEHTDWDWNSPYWRDLGSPWGGAHAAAGDVSRLLRCFVNPGAARAESGHRGGHDHQPEPGTQPVLGPGLEDRLGAGSGRAPPRALSATAARPARWPGSIRRKISASCC